MNRLVYSLIVSLIIVLFVNAPTFAAVSMPSVAVSYTNEQSNSVDVVLTWTAKAGQTYNVYTASTMLPDGSDLDYSPISAGQIETIGSTKKVVLPSLTKFQNYFVKVEAHMDAVTAVSFVRLYPANVSDRQKSKTNSFAHGNYEDNTAACAWCHSSHTSLKGQLLNESTYYKLCMLCHGTASTQSKYDVEAGQVAVDGGTVPSLAGPFGETATSKHNVNDSAEGWGQVLVPGTDFTDAEGKNQQISLSLTCVSCHNGHSRGDDNYRMLKKTIYADDAKTDSLKTTNIDFKAYATTSLSPEKPGEEANFLKGSTEFCSACHLNYDDGNAQTPGADTRLSVATSVYRHPSSYGSTESTYYSVNSMNEEGVDRTPSSWGQLPLQYNPFEPGDQNTNKKTAVVCLTCHYAHGTVKTFDTPEGQNKYVLRLDNYGACESCHKK